MSKDIKSVHPWPGRINTGFMMSAGPSCHFCGATEDVEPGDDMVKVPHCIVSDECFLRVCRQRGRLRVALEAVDTLALACFEETADAAMRRSLLAIEVKAICDAALAEVDAAEQPTTGSKGAGEEGE